jgi:hypothetical protein
MGLIIKSTEGKKITIQGTAIEVPEVYGRLIFVGHTDGVTIEIGISNYGSKEAFKGGASVLPCDVPNGSFSEPIKEGEYQSIQTAHEIAKAKFEGFGYSVEIDL